ncbi:MAG: hypothetical protein P8R01_09940 [Gammaproteobacteria bacterium]|nr:hypothetical protein [Gammaproteobacteria bacterium]
MYEISRYRQGLKYYQFAHKAFNRLAILTSEEDLRLSKSTGTLYLIPTSSEIEQGDAIILSFLEYEQSPQEWFSEARACGYSRDLLKMVRSNNRYSTQMGLPLLELGVGICFSSAGLRYLYYEDKPIMISGAIGNADRMSGCSWFLREAIEKSLFNIDVLRIADRESGKGEKGQHYIRYNVNGILLDDAAFTKLKDEMPMKSVSMKLNGKQYLFHIGQYPDASGRKKDLIIRERKVGIWKDSQI